MTSICYYDKRGEELKWQKEIIEKLTNTRTTVELLEKKLKTKLFESKIRSLENDKALEGDCLDTKTIVTYLKTNQKGIILVTGVVFRKNHEYTGEL